MRIEGDAPFHVNCCFTKRAVCYCVEGTPAFLRDPNAAQAYVRQAQQLWEYYHHPDSALFPERPAAEAPPAAPAAQEPPRPVSPPLSPLSDEHRALLERVEAARKKATYSAMTAASLAARGGLLYTPPQGVDIGRFMEHLETQNHSDLEASAAEVLRARSVRQAAAAAAAAAAPQMPDVSNAPHAIGTGMSMVPGQLMRAGSIETAQLRLPSDAAAMGAAAPFVPQQPVPMAPAMVPQAAAVMPPATGRAPQPRNANFVFFPAEHRRGPRKRAPPKAWRLKPEHITTNLRGELLQVLWPEDKQWWPALVIGVNPAAGTASFVYETGEREDGVRLAYLVSNTHVAWLNAETAERHGAGPAPATGGRKRTVEPPSRQASAAIPPYAAEGGEGFEMDGEEAVLTKLKGVTKRQRAAAAKQAAKQAAAAATASGGMPPAPTPTFSTGGPAFSTGGPTLSDPLPPSLGISLPSFLPDPSLELGIGGSIMGGVDSNLLPDPPAFQHQQPPRPTMPPPAPAPALPPVAPVPSAPAGPNAPSRIVRHLLQMGNNVLGLGVMLHINGITLPATISGTRPAQEALILEVRGRTVVVRAHDEGVRFGLSLVRQQPHGQPHM